MASENPPKKPSAPTYERNFGHCIILWKIKNFSLAACNPGMEIHTSEFTVSSLNVTRWQISFRIVSESHKLQLFLKRLDSETDDSFVVTWKIKILNREGDEPFVSETQSRIRSNSTLRVDAITPLQILRALPLEESDEVKMEFQMIVHVYDPNDRPPEIPTPNDQGITSLTTDLGVIAREGLHCDLDVVLNGKIMKAHKAILCPRSRKLSESARYNSKKIQLLMTDYVAVNRLFIYLYTGDLKYILVPPSISVYEYIVLLDIKELLKSYPQEKVTLETVIEAKKYEFVWTIQDFSNCDEPQDSETYEEDGMKARWKLRIYPKGLTEGTEVQKKYVYIEALALDCQRSQDVYVDFVTRNDEGLTTVAKRAHGKIKSGDKLGVLFMKIGGSSMAKIVVSNVLNIYFTVHTATGIINSTITETHPPEAFTSTNIDTYRILTDYMRNLISDDRYSDVALLVEDQVFEAHKFLLAGRSATFSRMIQEMKDDSTPLPINNMNKHAFRIFKDYLYTGNLSEATFPIMVHLFDAAVYFKVQALENICLANIRRINPVTSCYVLLFAHGRHLGTLKTEALQYIAAYRQHIVDKDGWLNMGEKDPALYDEVVKYLISHP